METITKSHNQYKFREETIMLHSVSIDTSTTQILPPKLRDHCRNIVKARGTRQRQHKAWRETVSTWKENGPTQLKMCLLMERKTGFHS
ncbi:mCG67596 [Mus musculus]|nr:mCG67596 [Mus musculus]